MSRKPRPCAVCPKFERGWCVHLAEMRPPDAPSCEYGRRKMNSQAAVEFNRRKFGYKPRKRKEPWELAERSSAINAGTGQEGVK